MTAPAQYNIKTSVPFMDHMFSHIAKHGFFDLSIKAKGDIEIDDHHTVEDLGIAFGQALKKALGDSKGIRRYGEATVPMDETLAQVVHGPFRQAVPGVSAGPAEEVQAQGLRSRTCRGLLSAPLPTMQA